MGASLAAYDFGGGKAIGGPTSGIVAGDASLVEACRAQNAGIGRPMKVGKEALQYAKASALGANGEWLAVRFAVAVKPALEAFKDGLGDVFGIDEVASFGPGEEGSQGPLVSFESALGIVALGEALVPLVDEAGGGVWVAAVKAVIFGLHFPAFAAVLHACEVPFSFFAAHDLHLRWF